MELGMIGLGRMGSKMTKRLLEGGHRMTVYDPNKAAVEELVSLGATDSGSIAEMVRGLSQPHAIWLMVPSGAPTESTIDTLAAELSKGDVVIDGGNSNYKDSMRRGSALAEKGIGFLDAGTSGGIWGLKEGYCLMVGGDIEAYRLMEQGGLFGKIVLKP